MSQPKYKVGDVVTKELDDICVCGHKRIFHSEKHCHGGSFCMCPVFVLSKAK